MMGLPEVKELGSLRFWFSVGSCGDETDTGY